MKRRLLSVLLWILVNMISSTCLAGENEVATEQKSSKSPGRALKEGANDALSALIETSILSLKNSLISNRPNSPAKDSNSNGPAELIQEPVEPKKRRLID